MQSLALAGLTLSHRINVAEVLALSALQGVINAFDMPGRQSFMVKMVEDRAGSRNAIAHQFVDGEYGATDRAVPGRFA